jgi:hypothetical protein
LDEEGINLIELIICFAAGRNLISSLLEINAKLRYPLSAYLIQCRSIKIGTDGLELVVASTEKARRLGREGERDS